MYLRSKEKLDIFVLEDIVELGWQHPFFKTKVLSNHWVNATSANKTVSFLVTLEELT